MKLKIALLSLCLMTEDRCHALTQGPNFDYLYLWPDQDLGARVYLSGRHYEGNKGDTSIDFTDRETERT